MTAQPISKIEIFYSLYKVLAWWVAVFGLFLLCAHMVRSQNISTHPILFSLCFTLMVAFFLACIVAWPIFFYRALKRVPVIVLDSEGIDFHLTYSKKINKNKRLSWQEISAIKIVKSYLPRNPIPHKHLYFYDNEGKAASVIQSTLLDKNMETIYELVQRRLSKFRQDVNKAKQAGTR